MEAPSSLLRAKSVSVSPPSRSRRRLAQTRSMERPRPLWKPILQHHAQPPGQLAARYRCDVHAAERHPPESQLLEPHHQVHLKLLSLPHGAGQTVTADMYAWISDHSCARPCDIQLSPKRRLLVQGNNLKLSPQICMSLIGLEKPLGTR